MSETMSDSRVLCPLCRGHGLVDRAELESRREAHASARALSLMLFLAVLVAAFSIGWYLGG